jgi:AraC-like DNA-binding protein
MRIHLPLDLRYSPTAGLVPGMQNPLVGNRAAAMQYEPLSRFPAVRTHDVDELRQRMSGLFSVRWLDLGRGAHNFDGRLNHHQMQDIGVSYARYGCSFEASLSHGHSYLRGFPIRGRGRYLLSGVEGSISRDHGIVLGPGSEVRLNYSSDFEHLILRISPERLVSTLSSLIDRPIDPPLQMTTNVRPSEALAAAQHRLIEFVAGELDRTDNPLPNVVLAELEQVLVLSFLNCNFHNYSQFLQEGAVRFVAPWQVRLAEEYIEQNWDQPITVEALAVAAKTSTRSLFYSFKKSRGVSPMTFARQIRLRHAKQMLTSAGPEASVTSIAALCGFGNPGHFARHYHSAFGEHPSATLKNAR